jgi:chromosomal replication initiator protein
MVATSNLGGLRDAWQQILHSLSSSVDSQKFDAFIAPLTVNESQSSSGLLVLETSSLFVARRLENEFLSLIVTTWQQLFGETIAINFVVKSADPTTGASIQRPSVVIKKPSIIEKKVTKTAKSDSSESFSLDENTVSQRYNFANFIVGSSNQFCHAAALQISENPGKTFNPLFIYGGVGLGKTHLLNAIANEVKLKHRGKRIIFLSAEAFTNALISSLRTGKMNLFKDELRSADVLLLDDIQFVAGKERTQEELFHTFNALYSSGAQIILTSDRMPQELNGIEDRLRTRFSWGLTADIQPPDFETRVAILKKRAETENIIISDAVISLIAEKVSHNVRELEGALTRVHALSSLQHQPITMALAESVISKLVKPKVIQITVEQIKLVVARHFRIKVSDMTSKRRSRNICHPRQIAMFLCRRHTTASYPEIGSAFGGRDHSSVIHAANVIGEQVRKDYEVQMLIKQIESDLYQ